MKYLRVAIVIGAVGWTTSAAWAQYGLYGSPELVRLPSPQAAADAPYSYPSPAVSARPINSPYASATADYGQVTPARYQPQRGGYLAQGPAVPPLPPTPTSADGIPPAPSPSDVPALPPTSGVISQMLEESGCYGGMPGPAIDRGYQAPGGQGLCGSGSASCEPLPTAACPLPGRWYGSVLGLMMTRNEANRLWTSYDLQNELWQIPTDADWDWRGGGEVRLGRWFGGCNPCATATGCGDPCGDPCGVPCYTPGTFGWAVEAAYWSLDSFSDSVLIGRSAAQPLGIGTPMDVIHFDFAGTLGDYYFGVAEQHWIRRESELHNVEVNAVFGEPFPSQCQPVQVQWFVGARYFRFADELSFGSVALGHYFGEAGGIHEAYINDRVKNDLVGCHFGVRAKYLLGYNLRLFANPSLGIYNNHIQNEFNVVRGDGTVATPNWPAGNPWSYPVNSSKDVAAFMGQIDVGAEWQFSPAWTATIGYRVLFATGIGLADHQIPAYYLSDVPDIAEINYNGELILHGAFAGLTLRF